MRSFVPTDEENTPFREAINRSVYCSLASVCNRTHRVRLTTGRVDATLDGASVPSRSRQQRDIMRVRRRVAWLVVVFALASAVQYFWGFWKTIDVRVSRRAARPAVIVRAGEQEREERDVAAH